jgi:prepilin-type N-terminal cleavage/methylation domain-containing protein
MNHRFSMTLKNLDRYSCEGFSLVETLISIVIIALATTAAVSLSNSANLNINRFTRKSIIDEYIDRDISVVRQNNDLLICSSGFCQLATTLPDKNSYFPDPSNATNLAFFNNLCRTSNGFTDALSSLGLSSEVVANTNNLLNRQVVSMPNGHRYTVIYTNNSTGQVERMITLTPTTVAWCPSNIPPLNT